MNTETTPPADASTAHANWGTAVILLVAAICAVVVFYVVSRPHHEGQPSVVGRPAAPVGR